MVFNRNSEALTLDCDKTICELFWVDIGLKSLWERVLEEEDSPFSIFKMGWEALPEELGRPKILGGSKVGGFKVFWITLRSFGILEM